MRKLTPFELSMAFCVEVVRQLWDRGLYRQNKWLQMCHDEWFDVWTIWRTSITMKDVDRQVAELNPEPVSVPEPIYWEEKEGETPLGGPIGFTYDFVDNPGSGPDSVQGPE
jgi:hypothetical protein